MPSPLDSTIFHAAILPEDASGNSWGKTLDVYFSVDKSPVLGTLDLSKVRDVARLGSQFPDAVKWRSLLELLGREGPREPAHAGADHYAVVSLRH